MLEEARLFLRCHLGSLDLAIDDLFHARQLVSVHTKGATRPAYGKNEPNLAVGYRLSSAFLYAICKRSAPNSALSTDAIQRVARGATTMPAAKTAAIHKPRQ
jgi:hypothetical protein